ncbi:MAG: hypothetical protein QOG48_1536, partial [Verrucomicrobiota bacterium]
MNKSLIAILLAMIATTAFSASQKPMTCRVTGKKID